MLDLPVEIKAGAREDVMLLLRTGDLKTAPKGPLATLTLVQAAADGQVVGGSTFVFKRARSG
jgi:hypothetical protein